MPTTCDSDWIAVSSVFLQRQPGARSKNAWESLALLRKVRFAWRCASHVFALAPVWFASATDDPVETLFFFAASGSVIMRLVSCASG